MLQDNYSLLGHTCLHAVHHRLFDCPTTNEVAWHQLPFAPVNIIVHYCTCVCLARSILLQIATHATLALWCCPANQCHSPTMLRIKLLHRACLITSHAPLRTATSCATSCQPLKASMTSCSSRLQHRCGMHVAGSAEAVTDPTSEINSESVQVGLVVYLVGNVCCFEHMSGPQIQ